MSLYAFDFRDQLYAPWEQARGALIDQLDLLYSGLNAATIVKDATTGLVTGIGGDPLNNVSPASLTVNLTTNATGVLPAANGGLPSGGTATTVLHGGASPIYATVNLVTDVTGILPVANGGTPILYQTGQITAAQANSLSTAPLTVITGVASNVIVPLAVYSVFSQTAGSFSGNSTPSLRYSTKAADICSFGTITSVTNPDDKKNIIISGMSTLFTYSTGTGSPIGADITLKASADVTNTGGSLVYVCAYKIAYLLFPYP